MKILKNLGIAAAVSALLLQTPMTLTAASPTPVGFISTFTDCTADFSVCTGDFTTSGALGNKTGRVTMLTVFNSHFIRAHCVFTFVFRDGSTIIIHEECHFATEPDRGRWEIVSGTGDYANLQGNGSSLMPDNLEIFVGSVR